MPAIGNKSAISRTENTFHAPRPIPQTPFLTPKSRPQKPRFEKQSQFPKTPEMHKSLHSKALYK